MHFAQSLASVPEAGQRAREAGIAVDQALGMDYERKEVDDDGICFFRAILLVPDNNAGIDDHLVLGHQIIDSFLVRSDPRKDVSHWPFWMDMAGQLDWNQTTQLYTEIAGSLQPKHKQAD